MFKLSDRYGASAASHEISHAIEYQLRSNDPREKIPFAYHSWCKPVNRDIAFQEGFAHFLGQATFEMMWGPLDAFNVLLHTELELFS